MIRSIAASAPGEKGMAMKGTIAAAVTVAILWLADVELNGGRYSDVVLRAIKSLI
jgi:hypothetical protein